MPNFADIRGQTVAAASSESVRRLDHAVAGYLGSRADTRARLDDLLALDPDCVLAQVLDGYVRLLASQREGHPLAAAALARARRAAGRHPASRREALHLDALDAWCRGDLRAAAGRWEALLAEFPRDVVAIKVSQFVLSYLGESERLRLALERVLPAWEPAVTGYGHVLGCYAYGLEESGEYTRAEAMGRRAVELDPSDIWAAHAVAHVAEMQGRLHDGLAWITALAPHWAPCNHFSRHLRWHEGLLHLDLERHDRVLALYDSEVRRPPTGEYLDVTNAVSLLWRLEQSGVDVGDRWRELAACARTHVGDHALVFADLHYLMALAAVGDAAGVDRFLESCERFARSGTGTEAEVMADVGLPLARAVLAHRRGDYREVVARLLPVRREVRRIGGSHAQRDLFEQLLIDGACRSRHAAAAELLAERTTQRPGNVWGWKHYAAVLEASAAPGAAGARLTLQQLRAR